MTANNYWALTITFKCPALVISFNPLSNPAGWTVSIHFTYNEAEAQRTYLSHGTQLRIGAVRIQTSNLLLDPSSQPIHHTDGAQTSYCPHHTFYPPFLPTFPSGTRIPSSLLSSSMNLSLYLRLMETFTGVVWGKGVGYMFGAPVSQQN